MPQRGRSSRGSITTSLDCANANNPDVNINIPDDNINIPFGIANIDDENVEDIFSFNILELNTQGNVPQIVGDGSPSLCSL